jgi:hemerythrin-like domain-containing protein
MASSATPEDASPACPETEKTTETLPKLTPSEFRQYNRLAEMMDNFHNHFRQTWTTMYDACSTSKRPTGMSLRQFLHYSLDFCNMLTMHHDIEEARVFPMLARKMPIFRNTETMKMQHKEIHEGLDKLKSWLEQCRDGESDYRAQEMRDMMDTFGQVLWEHLDAEVKQLGAENMRKFWTLKDMQRFLF